MAIHISEQDNKSILAIATGFTNGYHYNLNPYQGCAFGCQYCYVATLAVQERQDAWALGEGQDERRRPDGTSRRRRPAGHRRSLYGHRY